MTLPVSKRWQRRDRPWRSTLKGVVVASPNGLVEFEGAAASVWQLLETPTSPADLAASLAAIGAVEELEEFDPLARLVEHDLICEVP